ncbi:MAG: CDP-diacylglycerol--serine O-phosphatidyltransferase [Planctomycetota bacterium]
MNDRISFRHPIKRLKTLPVLPTLLTAGNLAAGVTAIMCAATDQLTVGAILIFVAMLCDMLDGKLARLTHTEGAFGAELDSLADVVSFGVAPAMLVHRLVLEDPGVFAPGERLIWLVTIFYCVMAAIRLARYNVEHDDDKATETFTGLPSPGSAALVCSWVLLYAVIIHPLHGTDPAPPWFVPGEAASKAGVMIMILCCSLLMVSNIPFPHIGNTLLGDRLGFRRVVLLIATIFLFAYRPVPMLAVATTVYVLYGMIPGLWQALRRWLAGRSLFDEDDADEDPDESDAQQRAHAG